MNREYISKLVMDILGAEGWSQEALALEVGVKQSTVSQWKNGNTVPHPRHSSKLHKIHAEARAHRWASKDFVPICAFAKSYPPDLHQLATLALDECLDFASLTDPLKLCRDIFSIDLHIRPARLPKDASAYTFANDLNNPSVFVVLIQKALSLTEQRRIAWEEVYAHVAPYPFRDAADDRDGGKRLKRPLPVSPSIIRHCRPDEESR